MTKSKYIKPFLHVFFGNFFVRLSGFLKELLLAWLIGPSKILDLFFFLVNIPTLINATWNRSVEISLLTYYEKYRGNHGLQEAKLQLLRQVFNFIIFSFIIYIVISILFPIIIYYFYTGYFSNEIIYAIIFINFTLIIETYLITIRVIKYSEQNFFLPSFIPIFQGIIMILGIIFFRRNLTLIFLAIIYSLGSLLQISVILKNEFKIIRYFFSLAFNFNMSKPILKDSLNISFAASLSSLCLLVDQAFALNIGEAANTYIHYGYFILNILSVLFITNIGTIYFPQFQKYIVEKLYHKLEEDAQTIVKVILVLSFFILIIGINNGYFIFEILIGHGKVSSHDLNMIYFCSLGYIGAFLGSALNTILIKILLVYMEYRLVLIAALINFVINISLNYFFILLFGVLGIALSTSVSFLIIVLIYIIFLQKRKGLNIIINKNRWFTKYIFAFLILGALEIYFLNYFNLPIGKSLLWNFNVCFGSLFCIVGILLLFKLIKITKISISIN